jgi:hypothetical protein
VEGESRREQGGEADVIADGGGDETEGGLEGGEGGAGGERSRFLEEKGTEGEEGEGKGLRVRKGVSLVGRGQMSARSMEGREVRGEEESSPES